jgi:hypothetical protein
MTVNCTIKGIGRFLIVVALLFVLGGMGWAQTVHMKCHPKKGGGETCEEVPAGAPYDVEVRPEETKPPNQKPLTMCDQEVKMAESAIRFRDAGIGESDSLQRLSEAVDKNVSDESQREHFKLLFRSIIHAAYANPAETPESFGALVKFGCNEGQKEQSGTGQ